MRALRFLLLSSTLILAGCPSEIPNRPSVSAQGNECGGTATLDGEVGDPCCFSGELACSGLDALICVAPGGGAVTNACGGCETLDVPDCGPCQTEVCDGEEALACSEDLTATSCGDDCGAYFCNEAAGQFECREPSGLGEPCGLCDAGVGVCASPGEVGCQQPEGFTGEETIGQTGCGYCGTGRVACGDLGPECVDEITKEVADGYCQCSDSMCQTMSDGVDCREHPMNCGPCRQQACDAVDCAADRTGEPCMNCGTIACGGAQGEFDEWVCVPNADLGGDCGTCENRTGTWRCDADEGVVCEGGANACGGCAFLDNTPGEACGCGGTWQCDGEEAVVCANETVNGCGGCDAEVDDLLGLPCGTCNMGEYICAGDEAVVCDDPEAGVNACGGCDVLEHERGEPCGECARYMCNDNGSIECTQLGRNSCGGCIDEDLQPLAPCGLCNQGVERCGDDDMTFCDESGIQLPGEACEGGYLTCVDDEMVCQPTPDGWVAISGGSYCMGTAADQVCRNQGIDEPDTELLTPTVLTHPFLVATHELDRAAWRAYDPDAVFSTCNCEGEGCDDDCPADFMTWFAALDYANWRSRAEGLTECYPTEVAQWAETPPTGLAAGMAIDQVTANLDLACDGYRLPTEAEWEYAARAGVSTRSQIPGELQVCGNSHDPEPILDSIAWWGGTAVNRNVHPVGTKTPNAWGLYDTLGNVSEMIMAQQYATTAPSVETYDRVWQNRWENRNNAMRRGGGANSFSWWVGLGVKRALAPHNQTERIGFRLVRTIPTPEAMRMNRYWTVPVCP